MSDRPDGSDPSIDESRYAPDPDLADLVKYANAFGLEADLLLTLPGQVIGGRLVSGERHYRGFVKEIEHASDASMAIRDLLDFYAQRYEGWGAESRDETANEPPPPLPPVAFIHLADAYIVRHDSLLKIGPWRGRLSEVVAWTLGAMSERDV